MSNAAASAIRDGPTRPAIVFEFDMDCLPARCRCGTSTDKNTHREEPVRRSAATGPTVAISCRERAEKERAPPLHDNPKARAEGGDTPVEQQPAAMQDFDPTYDRCGSNSGPLRMSAAYRSDPRSGLHRITL